MKKEGTESKTFSGLEFEINATITMCCRGNVRTLQCMGRLDEVPNLKTDHPYNQDSSSTRYDVVEHFYKSMHDLINECTKYLKSRKDVNEEALEEFAKIKEDDSFLEFMSDKKFDGICKESDDLLRKAQYQLIKDNYAADRIAVASYFYKTYLENKEKPKKQRKWPFYVWAAGVSIICAATLTTQIINYTQIKTFEKKASALELEVRGTVCRMEKNLEPENIIKKAENYLNSKEGKEYVDMKYEQFREWWKNENLATDQLNDFWEKKILPTLSDMNSVESDQQRAQRIVDELEKKFPELRKSAEALNQLKEILGQFFRK